MKKYTFELTIYEGRDHFWNNIKNTGCDEVGEMISNLLAGIDFETDGKYKNCDLALKKFEDSFD